MSAFLQSGRSVPAASFSIAANGTTAYIAWQTTTTNTVNLIPFSGTGYVGSSTPAVTGEGFGSNIVLDTGSTSKNPVVVADGINVYVAWQNEVAGDKNIKIVNSTDSGVNFGTVTNISKTDSANSIVPKLAEDDGTIHVAWLEDVSGTQQVFVASNGTSYTPVAVSSGTFATGHQIIADGVNLFTVWQDLHGGTTHEILFSNSTDSGVTFGTPIDLSQSSGDSVFPKISGNSTHVNVVWRDNTFLPLDTYGSTPKVDGQVWFKSSSDSGVSFGGLQVISESTDRTTNTFYGDKKTFPTSIITSNPAPVPNISSFGNVVVAVWNPENGRTDLGGSSVKDTWQGSLKASTASKIDISFNSTEYLTPRNATITVVDPADPAPCPRSRTGARRGRLI